MQANKKLTQVGDSIKQDFGPDGRIVLQITTTLNADGLYFYVTDGVSKIDDLSKGFSDREQATAYFVHIKDAAKAGKRIHQIVWEIQALEQAQNAATGRTEDEIAEALQADADANYADRVVENNHLMADRDLILAQADPHWRNRLRAELVQAAKRANQSGRLIHPTRTRVHCKPPTPAELARIRAHQDGIVTTAPGQPWTLLQAIVRRGLAVEHEVYGRHVLKSVRLNQRGLAIANGEQVAA